MSYIDDITAIDRLTLDEVIRVSRENAPLKYKEKPWTCPGLNHGTALLCSEEQLCCYIASYGEMHKEKINKALEKFPWQELTSDIEIIDWGCGQGIASLHLVSKLRDLNQISRLRKITLIEPSSMALGRATANVSQAVSSENVEIEAKNLYLPDAWGRSVDAIGELLIEEPICIHLFSNILDILQIDLKQLANLIASTGYMHYFVCIGPLNFGNHRIEAFSRYFAKTEANTFSNESLPQFKQLGNGKWYSCVTKGFKMVREDGKPFLVPLSFFPPKEFLASYKLDAFWASGKPHPDDAYKAFEVLAPFDIGASVYEDVDPIVAVLNNIVTRGTPTRCSPFIERNISDIFKATAETEAYGAINFDVVDHQIIDDNEDLLRMTPIGIARIQKVVIEAILTGRLPLDAKEWKVIVKEADYPCAALAFADLQQMYDHLCALSVEYSDRKFPKIDLSIINSRYTDSPLHLERKCVPSAKKICKDEEFDLVIDISFQEESDAEHVQFSEFKAKNDCYFNIRSCCPTATRLIYTSDRITYKPLTQFNQSGGYDDITETAEHLNYFLTLIFRKVAFRVGQLPILNRAMQNKSVIGLLPTGGGKSMTYQLAAMLQPGVTIVIDPLKSLMEDQYDGLTAIGIDACTYINSELKREDREANEAMMESSKVIFAFMSPERLCIYNFRERLHNMHDLGVYFSYGVIDEVHCVSEWGQDFRFSYLHLGRNLYSYVKAKNREISLFGLTATASFDVLSDVERELSGHGAFALEPDTIVRYENSNRLELQYKIERVDIGYENEQHFDDHGLLLNLPKPVTIENKWDTYARKSAYLKQLLSRIPGYIRELCLEKSINTIVAKFKSREELTSVNNSDLTVDLKDNYLERQGNYEGAGIVFCPHVKNTGVSVAHNVGNLANICDVGSFAGSNFETEPGVEVTDLQSMTNMRRFRDNKYPLMVATKAFGMGIDKPNVRFTINMNYSSSLESFVQEAGRAGRDRKMALSIILLANYNLQRISPYYPSNASNNVIETIKGHWFKDNDLHTILTARGITVDRKFIDICNPVVDFVRLKCNTNIVNADNKKKLWNCTEQCSKYSTCQLRHVKSKLRYEWIYFPDLQRYLKRENIRLQSSDYEYNGPDYGNVMYFFDNNFKGEHEEKSKMLELLNQKEVRYFFGNDKRIKYDSIRKANGFMQALLDCKIGDELVVLIPYDKSSYADIAKAIYRMCMVGLIDDYTQNYSNNPYDNYFRIVTRRKKPGSYYARLKEFLKRYYSDERAENEVEKASIRKVDRNRVPKDSVEILRCLAYLTEFVYDKVVMKRKRAIDDMRNFCLTGIDETKDWKEINEDLKDEIFFYFNSKFARSGYRAVNDEPFSLYDDIVGDKRRDFDTLFKYMRVLDQEVIGVSGSPKDNIKHLRGAVRLIRRSDTDTNPALSLLNVFCLTMIQQPHDNIMLRELEESFIEGYRIFKSETKDREVFYSMIERFYREFTENKRGAATPQQIRHLKELQILTELEETGEWLNDLKNNYTA